MTIDLDFTRMSHDTAVDLIYLIGTTATSPETLDRIVQYVIDNMADEKCISKTYHCCCLDSICSNTYLSKESIINLVEHYKNDFDIWDLASRDNLDGDVIELMVKHFTKLYILIELFEKYAISENIADLLATRIIAGDVRIDRGYYKDGQIESIIARCSDPMKARLIGWWNKNADGILHHLYP